MSLSLTSVEIRNVATSWADIEVNNKYHKDLFISRLFANLIAANADLKNVLNNESTIHEQLKAFNEILSFTVMYMSTPEVLDECMQEFLRENPRIITIGVQYLEPMGVALIQTFRQWLGKGKFHPGLETLWIKVYVYVANSILSHEELTDYESIYSQRSEKESESEQELEPVQPLKLGKPEPVSEEEAEEVAEHTQEEFPEAPAQELKPRSILDNSPTIEFDLSKNEKYKGFRRSVDVAVDPVSVKVPQGLSFKKPLSISSSVMSSLDNSLSSPVSVSSPSSAQFDPRRKRSSPSADSIREEDEEEPEIPIRRRPASISIAPSVEEPAITPRSASRPSFAEEEKLLPAPPTLSASLSFDPRKLKFEKPVNVIEDTSDDEFETKDKAFGFDPRRNTKKTVSEPLETKTTSSEGSVSDVEDDTFRLAENNEEEDHDDLLDFSQPAIEQQPSKRAMFDQNSFGIKGLAPIVEDDTASSTYESENDSSYEAGGELTLDRSSTNDASSQTSALSLHNSDYKSSISSGTESAANSPLTNKWQMNHTRQQSDASIPKPVYGQRVYASSTTSFSKLNSSTQQRVSLGFMRSSFILKKEMEDMGYNEPENVLMKPPTIPAAIVRSAPVSARQSSVSLNSDASSNDDDCFDMLNAFVVEKDTKVTAKASPKAPSTSSKKSLRRRLSLFFSSSSPDGKTSASSAYTPAYAPSTTSSYSSPYSATKTPQAPKSNVSRKPSVANALVSDLASIHTTSSSMLGFSFFSKRRSLVDTRRTNDPRLKNKYNVRKLQYDLFVR